MGRFDEILGHGHSLDVLNRMLDAGRVPHAMVFHGPESTGKGTVARLFAAALLCSEAGPCGNCTSCKTLTTGGHPDLMTLKRLPKPKKAGELRRFIIVEQIRALSDAAPLAPRIAPRRVFVIDPADAMIANAQNALLKTLEEPPGAAVLILVASRLHALLPTVRSRCFSVAFGTIDSARLGQMLEQRGLPSDEALARASLAEGRPGRALDLDLDELRERRNDTLVVLETLTGRDRRISELPALAASLAGRDEDSLTESLDLLQVLLRDAARAAIDPSDPALVHADVGSRLRDIGSRMPSKRAAGIIGSIDRLRSDLRFNINRTLVAEAVLAALAGGPLP